MSVELGLGERHVAADVARQQCLRVREFVLLQLLLAIETLAALAKINTTLSLTSSRKNGVRVSSELQLLQES